MPRCSAFLLALCAGVRGLVPPPTIEVGTSSYNGSEWHDTYHQHANGCFEGHGHSGYDYTYFGEITQVRCRVPEGGDQSCKEIVWGYWWAYHDSPDEASYDCSYKKWCNHVVVSRRTFRVAATYSTAMLKSGNLPFLCPPTADEAASMNVSEGGGEIFTCVGDCGEDSCAPAADLCSGAGPAHMRCGDLRDVYKRGGCCGAPDKMVEIP